MDTIRYTLGTDAQGCDTDNDGVNDKKPWEGPCSLGKEENGGGLQPVADNVDAIEFCYVLDNGSATLTPRTAKYEDIEAVYVSMLVRSTTPVKRRVEKNTFTPAAADEDLIPNDIFLDASRPPLWGEYKDGYKRELSIVKVRFRNMGINPFGD